MTINRAKSPQVSSPARTQAVQADRQAQTEALKDFRFLEPGVDGPETRQQVSALQAKLVETGSLQAGQFKDGVYDDAMSQGVMRFQQEMKKRGLNPEMMIDGKVGQQTWGAFLNPPMRLPPGKNLLKDAGAAEPASTDPKADKGWQAGDTKAADAKAADAKAADAKAADAKAADAKAADAKATDPKATDPKATDPKANDPKAAEPGAPKGPSDSDMAQGAADAQLTAGTLAGSTFNAATGAANQLNRAERVGSHYDKKATKQTAAAERARTRAANAPDEAARNKYLEQANKADAKAEKFKLKAEDSRTRDFFGRRTEPAATEPVKAGTTEPVKAGTTEPVKAGTTGTSGTAPAEPTAEPTIRARTEELARLEGNVTTERAAYITARENAAVATGNHKDLEAKAQAAEKSWAEERKTVSDTARKAGDQKLNDAWAKANEAGTKATAAQNAAADAQKQLLESTSKVEEMQKADQAALQRAIKSGAPAEPSPTAAATKAATAAPAEPAVGTATKGFFRNIADSVVEKTGAGALLEKTGAGALLEKAGPALKTTATAAAKVGEIGVKAAGVATRLVSSAIPALNLVGTGLAAIEANNHAATVEADPKASATKKALARWAARTSDVAVGGAGVSVLPVPVVAQVIGGVTSFGGTLATLGLQAVEYFQ